MNVTRMLQEIYVMYAEDDDLMSCGAHRHYSTPQISDGILSGSEAYYYQSDPGCYETSRVPVRSGEVTPKYRIQCRSEGG